MFISFYLYSGLKQIWFPSMVHIKGFIEVELRIKIIIPVILFINVL